MRPLRPDGIEVPLPRRYRDTSRGFAEGMERHRLAMGAGDPAYRDPVSGLAVFTARFTCVAAMPIVPGPISASTRRRPGSRQSSVGW